MKEKTFDELKKEYDALMHVATGARKRAAELERVLEVLKAAGVLTEQQIGMACEFVGEVKP